MKSGATVKVRELPQAKQRTGEAKEPSLCFLTTTMQAMRETVQAMKEQQLDCKIIIGGAPINESFAEEIGADGYAPDAARAVELCKSLLAS